MKPATATQYEPQATLGPNRDHINCPCWETGSFVQAPCPWHDGKDKYPIGAWKQHALAAEYARGLELGAEIAAKHAAYMDESITVLRKIGIPATHHKTALESARHIEKVIRAEIEKARKA